MLGVSGATEAARLFVTVGSDTTGLDRGLGASEGKIKGLGSSMGGLIRAAGGLYAVKKGFDATIGAAIEWESEFAGVEKTVDGTADELAGLESELRGMAKTMPIARRELAGIAEAAGALGIATADISDFTETVAMIGETTNVSSDQAATALGQLSNVLGLTQQDYDRFGAALVDLGNKGASTEADILAIASRAGSASSLIGVAADETLGWASAVANLGIEAEAGGSAIQRFFIGAAEHVGKAGDELELMADTAGVAVGEFSRLFNEDATSALSAFIDGLGDLTQAEQIAVLEALGFNDVRIQRTLLGLAGNVDNLTGSLEIGAEAWEDNTALTEEYGKRAKTTAARIETLGNRWDDLLMTMGQDQSGPVNALLGLADAVLGGLEERNARVDETLDLQRRAMELMEETGMGFGPALAQAKREFAEMPVFVGDAFRGAVAAWKQEDLGGEIIGNFDKVDDYFSRGGLDIAGPITEEMEAAREAALAGSTTLIAGITNLFETDTAAADAATAFVESLADPFKDVDQIEAIIGNLLLDEIPKAFEDGSTVTSMKSLEWVNAQLEVFDTLNPGMLERGRDGGSGLLAGMEEYDEPLQTFAETLAGDLLDHMTLAEAMRQLGYDGLADYFAGMEAAGEANAHVAGAIASRAVNNLDWSDLAYDSGYNTGKAWADGLWASAELARSASWYVAVAGGSALVAYSPPKEGPLSTIDDSGYNVGATWAHGLGAAANDARAEASMLAAAAYGPLAGSLGPEVAFGYGAGATPGSGGGDTYITEVNLYFEGEAPTDAPQIADLVERAERMATTGVGS